MIRDPKDLKRYNASERANHWVIGISFILLALSGLAFFHPAFYPLTMLFGGGAWARILHPYIGVIIGIAFAIMFVRFYALNVITPTDREWLSRVDEMIEGNDHNMPTQRSMEMGLFEVKETTVSHSDGHISVNKTPKVTGKGQQYFINLFLSKK